MPNLNIDQEVFQWLQAMNPNNGAVAAPPVPPPPQNGLHAHHADPFANWQQINAMDVQHQHAAMQGQLNQPQVVMDDIWQDPPEVFDMPQLVTQKKNPPMNAEGNTSKKMQELHAYPAFKLAKTVASAYEKGRSPAGMPFSWTTQQGYVGIEVEVENIVRDVPLQAYWQAKADGSLRNHGVEFVSNPLAVKQIQLAVEHLYSAMYQDNNPDFSPRTSVHVHVNCRDMTQDQVFNFVLLYAIFEKHFFAVAGTKRLNSIFCVPMYRCNILKNARDLIYGFSPNWKKYCALNLLPLVPNNDTGCYGTIEFRHLYGTANPQELMSWINDILCLRQWAMTFENEWLLEQIKTMNTTSQYLGLYNQVFEKGRKILTEKLDFEECISDIKRELFGQDYWSKIGRDSGSAYWQLVRNLGIRG